MLLVVLGLVALVVGTRNSYTLTYHHQTVHRGKTHHKLVIPRIRASYKPMWGRQFGYPSEYIDYIGPVPSR
jgi:hypothetical protein